jgi:protein TonB
MNTNEILKASLIDIIFDEKNKNYGAYELRKNYQKRLKRAIIGACSLLLVTCSMPILADMFDKETMETDVTKKPVIVINYPIEIIKTKPKKKEPEVFIKVEPHNTVKNTPPEIVKAVVAKVDNKMPTKKDLLKATSGITTSLTTNTSTPTEGIATLPASTGGGTTLAIVTKEPATKTIFESIEVEIEAEYPGGMDEFTDYLSANVKYPTKAVDNGVDGIVLLNFTVDKNGIIENITVERGLGMGCDEEAIRVLKATKRWTPASMNGQKVATRCQLPITFKLD